MDRDNYAEFEDRVITLATVGLPENGHSSCPATADSWAGAIYCKKDEVGNGLQLADGKAAHFSH